MSDKKKAVALRLSQETYNEIAKKAKESDRSVNSMIIVAIKEYVKG